MLPKGYKVIINWFQEVSEDPDYANPEMRNETRDMNGSIVESDDEDEAEERKGWKAEDFEEWVPLDEKRGGVVLEEIKDEVGEVGKEEESKVAAVIKNDPTAIEAKKEASSPTTTKDTTSPNTKDIITSDTKENTPVHPDASEKPKISEENVNIAVDGLQHMVGNAATNGLPILTKKVEEKEGIVSEKDEEKEVKPVVKEIYKDDGAEDGALKG
jgi:hypothetical protein